MAKAFYAEHPHMTKLSHADCEQLRSKACRNDKEIWTGEQDVLMQHVPQPSYAVRGPSLRISIANVHARFGANKHEFCKKQTACASDKVADAVSPEGAFYREEEDSCNASVGAYRMPGTC